MMGNERVISVTAGVDTGARMVREWSAEWCAEWCANGAQNGGRMV